MKDDRNKKLHISFACVQNSCRSQIAEYFAKKYNDNEKLVFSSFGTKLAPSVNPRAVDMIFKMYGDDISGYRPKTINEISSPDILISMGCDVVCPLVDKEYYDNWNLPDPVKMNDEGFKEIVIKIENNVKQLINDLINKDL